MISDSAESGPTPAEARETMRRDPLTGLPHRQQLMRELEVRLNLGVRQSRSGAVLLLDIDNFKVVNDTVGHAAGDEQLRVVGAVLRERFRETDIVARIGSDEFAVVLGDVTEAQAHTIAREIRALLREPSIGRPIRVSIGISMFDAHGELTAEALLVCADIALYEAQAAGGDRAAIYRLDGESRLASAHRIRAALASGGLKIYAQPILDLYHDDVAWHELLVRMVGDDGAIIAPPAFIPVAERFGLIGDIDRWVTAQALDLAAAGHRVSVNLSAHSMTDPSIVAAVQESVARGVDPRNVMFEITETAAITNTAQATLLAGALARIGCELALDDFGTGFSSFTYLKHFPARFLKIDAEFVRHVRHDATDQAIVRSICGVACALGKATVAEGVEDRETLEVLRVQGVDYAQGFFIGHPKPAPPPDRTIPPRLRAN